MTGRSFWIIICMYSINTAGQFWKRNGVELFTAPMELNAEELNVLGLEESELVIYGRIPVMTSAQCVVKTTNGCTHHPVTTTLTDRRGKQFPVKITADFAIILF